MARRADEPRVNCLARAREGAVSISRSANLVSLFWALTCFREELHFDESKVAPGGRDFSTLDFSARGRYDVQIYVSRKIEKSRENNLLWEEKRNRYTGKIWSRGWGFIFKKNWIVQKNLKKKVISSPSLTSNIFFKNLASYLVS